jgi:hypothetical protein
MAGSLGETGGVSTGSMLDARRRVNGFHLYIE